ncbi:ferredoxin [Aestuariivirga sp.]|uniref:ferredoxin n=1 Tax=Aestuariivirga sp. TaxID=2650926 RepID=UPI003BAA2508
MEHPILTAIRRAGFTPLGWFEPGPEDRAPEDARFIILIGNAGPEMFRRFARERDPSRDKMNDWTRDTVQALGRDLDAKAAYPFDLEPPWPFLTWARRAGAGFSSPLGLNIHPAYGLWHAYRAALLFPVVLDLPVQDAGPHPCERCVGKPCLSACPVQAFDGASYNVPACAAHLATAEGQLCVAGGCLARHACPVGQGFAYAPAQAQFHMRAFLAARQEA